MKLEFLYNAFNSRAPTLKAQSFPKKEIMESEDGKSEWVFNMVLIKESNRDWWMLSGSKLKILRNAITKKRLLLLWNNVRETLNRSQPSWREIFYRKNW